MIEWANPIPGANSRRTEQSDSCQSYRAVVAGARELPAVVGLLFMGIAFFVGGILAVAAEKLGPKTGGG